MMGSLCSYCCPDPDYQAIIEVDPGDDERRPFATQPRQFYGSQPTGFRTQESVNASAVNRPVSHTDVQSRVNRIVKEVENTLVNCGNLDSSGLDQKSYFQRQQQYAQARLHMERSAFQGQRSLPKANGHPVSILSAPLPMNPARILTLHEMAFENQRLLCESAKLRNCESIVVNFSVA